MATIDIADELDGTVLFGGLEDTDLRRLAGIARESNLSAGETLFDQGDESDGLYIVVSGILRIYLTADDTREATINLLEEGEVIGEIALLDGLPRSAGAAALTDARLIFIPREPFMEMLDSSPRLARQIILMLCERLRAATRISNPGCYALASIAIVRPLIAAGLLLLSGLAREARELVEGRRLRRRAPSGEGLDEGPRVLGRFSRQHEDHDDDREARATRPGGSVAYVHHSTVP